MPLWVAAGARVASSRPPHHRIRFFRTFSWRGKLRLLNMVKVNEKLALGVARLVW